MLNFYSCLPSWVAVFLYLELSGLFTHPLEPMHTTRGIKLFYAGPSVIYYNEVQESLGILLRASYLVDTEYDVLSNFSLSAGLTYQM